MTPRYTNGSEVFPSRVHLLFLVPARVQPVAVVLHPPVAHQSSGHRLRHTFTLCLCSTSQSLWRLVQRHHARGTQSTAHAPLSLCEINIPVRGQSLGRVRTHILITSCISSLTFPLQVGIEEDCCQRVVSQLCGALSHLHSLGFVHRDLKPENVFLCDAACRWVKLGDFGMVSLSQRTAFPCVSLNTEVCFMKLKHRLAKNVSGSLYLVC